MSAFGPAHFSVNLNDFSNLSKTNQANLIEIRVLIVMFAGVESLMQFLLTTHHLPLTFSYFRHHVKRNRC